MNTQLFKSGYYIQRVNPAISQTRQLFFLIIAIIYGYILSQVPDNNFIDFENYLIYAGDSWTIFFNRGLHGLIPLIFNEPIWLLINAALALWFEPESVIRIIIFFSATSAAWLVLRHNAKLFLWLVLFLFLPNLIKNYLIHIRQGTAIAFFLWGWYSANRSMRWTFLALTPLVHVSFFFILFFLVLTWILKTIRLGAILLLLAYVAAGVVVCISASWLAQLTGARQGSVYDFEMIEVSGLGFVLWLIILAIFLTSGRSYLRKYSFEVSIITFYLVSYWLIEVTGRVFESGLILVLIAGLALIGWRKKAFLAVVLGSGVFAWGLRISMPTLGFS